MIDYERLLNSVKDLILDEDGDKYDLNSIVRNAESCWDDTAILVKSTDFTFIFDKISYECLSVDTNDFKEEEMI